MKVRWSSRFKQATAAKKRNEPALATDRKIDTSHARSVDPTPYLTGVGFDVRREGKTLSVRRGKTEVYRIDRKSDSAYIWCDSHSAAGGDMIDLVREIEPGLDFRTAVSRITGGSTAVVSHPATPMPEPVHTISMPVQRKQDVDAGRAYLERRGISPQTIDFAEKSGFLKYSANSVLFVGYDGKNIKSVTSRSTCAAKVQKRDLRGSDKSFPGLLRGSPSEVAVVEGGTDALAVLDVAKRFGRSAPTVIISGGVGIRSWTDNKNIQLILENAEKIVIFGENEKDSDTQKRTDEQRKRLVDRIRSVARTLDITVQMPSRGKDIAEQNQLARTESQEQTPAP